MPFKSYQSRLMPGSLYQLYTVLDKASVLTEIIISLRMQKTEFSILQCLVIL